MRFKKFMPYWINWQSVGNLPCELTEAVLDQQTLKAITDPSSLGNIQFRLEFTSPSYEKRSYSDCTLSKVWNILNSKSILDFPRSYSANSKPGTNLIFCSDTVFDFQASNHSGAVLEVLFFLKQYGDGENPWGPFSNIMWYFYHQGEDRRGEEYKFFLVSNNKIIRECMRLKEDYGEEFLSQLLTTHDFSLLNNNLAWDTAEGMYWHQEFKKTMTGRIFENYKSLPDLNNEGEKEHFEAETIPGQNSFLKNWEASVTNLISNYDISLKQKTDNTVLALTMTLRWVRISGLCLALIAIILVFKLFL